MEFESRLTSLYLSYQSTRMGDRVSIYGASIMMKDAQLVGSQVNGVGLETISFLNDPEIIRSAQFSGTTVEGTHGIDILL